MLVKVKVICPKRTTKPGAQAVRDKEVCHLRREERGASLWSQQFLTGLGTLRDNRVTTALTLPLVEMAEIDRLVTEAESRIRSPVSHGVGMGMRRL